MRNPSWWEDPPEDPPEDEPTDESLRWDTPDHAPYIDQDCDYWRRLFTPKGEKP